MIVDRKCIRMITQLFQQGKEARFPNAKAMFNFLPTQMPLIVGIKQYFDLVSCELFVEVCHVDSFLIHHVTQIQFTFQVWVTLYTELIDSQPFA
jgi:hypothetical protein